MSRVRRFQARVITLVLQHSVPDLQENNVLDRLSDEVNRDYLRIPSQQDGYFLKITKEAVYDHMTEDDYFSYSGPTSMGKSFVMRTFIRERIKNKPRLQLCYSCAHKGS